MTEKNSDIMEKIVSLSKRRGFIFPTAEKYGGLGGFWDWGPLGVELKNNIKQEWWKHFVHQRSDVVGLDAAIITNPEVWFRSGHRKGFGDWKIECRKCNERYQLDKLNIPQELVHQIRLYSGGDWVDINQKDAQQFSNLVSNLQKDIQGYLNSNVQCKNCGKPDWSLPDYFDLMFETHIGPTKSKDNIAYLRPETAQNIFVNFENVQQSMRLKVPFGIAQIGKAFRNEITPGNFIFRSREFEQMELEFFIDPREDKKWFDYWVEESLKWFIDLGVKKENIKKREQGKDELAHYAKATTDLEYNWPFEKGFAELIGIANRTDYDLKAHGFSYKDDKNEFVPYVIEPSFGVERPALAFLLDAYDVVEGGRTTTTESNKEEEVVLRLDKRLAPIKVAVLPLSKKETIAKPAKEIFNDLNKHFNCQYDEVASIGRRYRRQDEIGTPYCVTFDFDSLEDKKVTVRDRDTMEQERVAIFELTSYLREKFQ
ncbi:MAG: glycine--tRNA ligase [Patescibacteria group bacterium]